ncbi:hypothetical protein GUITHDRAFT_148272 [Guillardia theta CCMP2712]|uniref:NmrA-like domain-containing protein n=1 Tax=Guillardia theta (strain CCMP2712) TaxID=905079 RepID=L1IAT7_GUITC|nr:hypothetical protein GUITHDRAFT_148272 [Guillardia theta CCMP2712]EKX32960.1 hypothetical protein GUITHDRAFT_148272 [Guillardia theta CCMP2712]|eukprot:XP_005819940.1 hypothetical protein GUITHDRAFT_148272 [Guillardia theta CCMP2712]
MLNELTDCERDGELRLVRDSKDASAPSEIRVITRDVNSSKARALGGLPGVKLFEADSCNPSSLVEAFRDVQRVFVALPQALPAEQMVSVGNGIADVAKACGVKLIVRISSLGIDSMSTPFLEDQGPLGNSHVACEEHIKSIGLIVTSIRPTSFFTNFNYDLPGILQHSRFSSPLGKSAKVNWISLTDIGNVSARALTHHEWDGKVLDITGPAVGEGCENCLGAVDMQNLLTEVAEEMRG